VSVEVLRALIRYWRNSRDISKGAKEILEYITEEDVEEFFKRLVERKRIYLAAVDVCEKIVDREAEKYAFAMCGNDEQCRDEMYKMWIGSQGVHVEEQCINGFSEFTSNLLYDLSECFKECGKERSCLEACLSQKLR